MHCVQYEFKCLDCMFMLSFSPANFVNVLQDQFYSTNFSSTQMIVYLQHFERFRLVLLNFQFACDYVYLPQKKMHGQPVNATSTNVNDNDAAYMMTARQKNR